MRRHARTLITIAILVLVSVVILGVQKIEFGNFQRGGDTILGLSLGLELQGGSHLVYQALDPVTDEPFQPDGDGKEMDALKRSIERRVAAAGLGEPIIQILGENRLLIQMPGVEDPERAKTIIGETAQLEFKHRQLNVPRNLDEIGSDDIVSVTAGPFPVEEELEEATEPEEEGESTETETATGAEEESGTEEEAGVEEDVEGPPVIIVEFTESGAEKFAVVVDRLTASLTSAQQSGLGTTARPSPPSSLEMSIAGNENYRSALLGIQILRIGTSASFAFPFDPGTGEPPTVEQAREVLGDDPEVEFVEIQGFVDEEIGLTGDDLAVAYPGTHSVSQQPIVTVVFKDRGARIFGELTGQIAGSQTDEIAIFLDDQQLISPRVTGVITAGTATIEGDFTIDRVRDLALLLESGRLPLPIELIRERNVDAILGADSLQKSLIAGIVGLALVLVFMVLYYRVPGTIAAAALFIYAALVLATLKILPGSFTTLNLSGVAALILSIGMAVDANILIFERMKDELRGGRTLLSAINIGFNRAWPAIRDGNVSTLITCGVLFWFSEQLGETVLQGFAVTLAIGVAWSMFSAITVSRTLLRVMASTGASRRLGLFLPVGEVRTSREPGIEGGRG